MTTLALFSRHSSLTRPWLNNPLSLSTPPFLRRKAAFYLPGNQLTVALLLLLPMTGSREGWVRRLDRERGHPVYVCADRNQSTAYLTSWLT
jgi:hypothetical protein